MSMDRFGCVLGLQSGVRVMSMHFAASSFVSQKRQDPAPVLSSIDPPEISYRHHQGLHTYLIMAAASKHPWIP